jgi:ABC-type sugar transport system permease subunit
VATSNFVQSPPRSCPRNVVTHSRRLFREAVLAYLLILPSFIILFVFGLYPVLRAGYISLHEWSIIKGRFVGLENYSALLKDPEVGQSLQVTVFYVIATVPLTMLIALVLAYLLFKPIRFRDVLRTLYFLPYVTSVVPAAMVWQWIFNSQAGILNAAAGGVSKAIGRFLQVAGNPPWVYVWLALMIAWIVYLLATAQRHTRLTTGLLIAIAGILLLIAAIFWRSPTALKNTIVQFDTFFPVRWLQEPRGIFLYLGRKWGFTPPTWLQGPSMALLGVSIVSMWHYIGYDIVIYLAGLFNVPPELYEAARIDGASEGEIFWKITFPLLSPTTFFLLTISTIGAFRAFTMFYVLTQGGPLKTTMSITYLIYDKFYTGGYWGYASAIAFVLFGIILVMTLLNQRFVGRRVIYQ